MNQVLKINNYKVGSDPEAFIVLDNKIISSVGLIPGSKDEPYDIGKGCAIQTDNVLAEWCLPPTTKSDEFWESLSHCVGYAEDILPANHRISFRASANVTDDQLMTPEANLFGCEPSFNAWRNGKQNRAPKSSNRNLRSAGFHLHIGYDNPTDKLNIEIIKMMDLFLGIPSMLIDPDTERRKLYGKAGEFRHKKYGVEYRVLSSYLGSSKELVDWMFDQIQVAVDYINVGGKLDEEESLQIQMSINDNDQYLVSKLMDDYAITTPVLV